LHEVHALDVAVGRDAEPDVIRNAAPAAPGQAGISLGRAELFLTNTQISGQDVGISIIQTNSDGRANLVGGGLSIVGGRIGVEFLGIENVLFAKIAPSDPRADGSGSTTLPAAPVLQCCGARARKLVLSQDQIKKGQDENATQWLAVDVCFACRARPECLRDGARPANEDQGDHRRGCDTSEQRHVSL
jgi:hypothetical protein